MADKNSSKNNFIMQAGILAAAGIISRIIGLLYRGPLQSVIGNLGLGYYQSAYNYYTIWHLARNCARFSKPGTPGS